ncbi:MAG: endonuclease/exonuclease/phosphatase family protein [Bdellovibrionaceae bacterium]|nr:endonuclease/exonuclease/phosphatase family protein [Pseudobdellovibrionaceae bacterium]MDW8190873.1 endonuclease/exonuclease/phosphatase family protein [Pseudobdellovibrionaceae bacterium]
MSVFILVLISVNALADFDDPYKVFQTFSSRKITISPAPLRKLSSELSVLVWNVYKGKLKNQWREEFSRINREMDLTLIQEAMVDSYVDEVLRSQTHQGWNFSRSFEMSEGPTGVATGSRAHAEQWETLVSPDLEPILNTPKVSQASWYSIEGEQTLLVINSHIINFVRTQRFKRHIQSIIPVIKSHVGPVIWAGDFNTWSDKRMRYLLRVMSELGFRQVTFDEDERVVALDHIFVRDCNIVSARIAHDYYSSDHKPLVARLKCPGL